MLLLLDDAPTMYLETIRTATMFFIHSDIEERVRRATEEYGLDPRWTEKKQSLKLIENDPLIITIIPVKSGEKSRQLPYDVRQRCPRYSQVC